MFLPQELIRKKRDGHALEPAELEEFLQGFLSGDVSDYQMSAMLMAIFLRGMNAMETAQLTKVMRDSGEVFRWDYEPRMVVDKHSTGGVGDKTSLVLLPLVALEGVRIPMMAGRGLGHTGGTLDKLAAIGVNVFMSKEEARRQVDEIGCVFMGQTEAIVPLDRRLYALRDVTATVESIPLIVGSILSKKLAEGLGALVMDVKFGSGAFMQTMEDARKLASSLVSVGQECGTDVRCLLTDMNSPLGVTAGNAIEVYECLQILQGEGPADTRELILELGANMVQCAYPDQELDAIRERLAGYLDGGAAMEKFRQVVLRQGAQAKFLDYPDQLRQSTVEIPVRAPRAGFVGSIDVRRLGLAILEMGGGRRHTDDVINPWVGLTDLRRCGDEVGEGDLVAMVLGTEKAHAERAAAMVQAAYSIVDQAKPAPLIAERMGAS